MGLLTGHGTNGIFCFFYFLKKNIPGCPLAAPPELHRDGFAAWLLPWFYLYTKTELIRKTGIHLTKGTPTEDL